MCIIRPSVAAQGCQGRLRFALFHCAHLSVLLSPSDMLPLVVRWQLRLQPHATFPKEEKGGRGKRPKEMPVGFVFFKDIF